ncbi:uncharacterized protein V1518DRAFT_410184 [Limtongia smithiae]|uniref:uncharacterized protein n=1 Tax=Limtongia smithiae TaxID=1125753 RepID=UPI0034CEED35
MFHPVLWPSFLKIVLPLVIIFVITFSGWYVFVYPPLLCLFLFLNGPMGIVSSFVLAFQQACTIYMLVARTFFLKTALRNTFDTVLKMQGLDDLLTGASGDNKESFTGGVFQKLLDLVLYKLFTQWRKFTIRMTSPYMFLKQLLLFPIQFIPIVGPFVLAILKSVDTGKMEQARYFQLKGFNAKQIRHFVRRRYGGYFTFGFCAGILEMIPLIGIFFNFTNTTGAALWAAKMENKLRKKATD